MKKLTRRLITIIMIATPCAGLFANGGDAAIGAVGGLFGGLALGSAMSRSSSSSSSLANDAYAIATQNNNNIQQLHATWMRHESDYRNLKLVTIPELKRKIEELKHEIDMMKEEFASAINDLKNQLDTVAPHTR